MNCFQLRQSVTRLTMAVLLSTIAAQLSIPAIAQPASIQFEPPPPPPKGEPTGRGQGGGSRGPCSPYNNLIALVPVTQGTPWGLTTAERPSIWFHAPNGLLTGATIEFALRDEAGKTLYTSRFPTRNTPPGVFSLTLPNTAQPLQAGGYRWALSISCSADVPDRPISISGRIQRILPQSLLQQQLRQAKTPLEQAAVYAKGGIWYDALTTLGTPRCRSSLPNSALAAAWTDLLQQVNLTPATSVRTITRCGIGQ
ncbi:DUF928 domain-containing protein [Leptolyngbya sp. FACHB-36]|uniref:DUF928 domain-containing protein n=1 Tax=Leptolyngbya sp. FACHB-36 TaxID=2692808 RepID=UPI001681924A|nr:DUF928 domain-containing protein [Leptolyngbya sp. FACHB-36]MBD2020865.1 DUF928 domain-containing protein [Leptolyngbya sp. FACHB-36]